MMIIRRCKTKYTALQIKNITLNGDLVDAGYVEGLEEFTGRF